LSPGRTAVTRQQADDHGDAVRSTERAARRPGGPGEIRRPLAEPAAGLVPRRAGSLAVLGTGSVASLRTRQRPRRARVAGGTAVSETMLQIHEIARHFGAVQAR